MPEKKDPMDYFRIKPPSIWAEPNEYEMFESEGTLTLVIASDQLGAKQSNGFFGDCGACPEHRAKDLFTPFRSSQ